MRGPPSRVCKTTCNRTPRVNEPEDSVQNGHPHAGEWSVAISSAASARGSGWVAVMLCDRHEGKGTVAWDVWFGQGVWHASDSARCP